MELTKALESFEQCRKALGHVNIISSDIVAGKDDFETLIIYTKVLKEVYRSNSEDVMPGVLPVVDFFRMQVHHETCTGNTHLWVESDSCGSWSLHATRRDTPWDILREDHLKIIFLAGYTPHTLGPTNAKEEMELEDCLTVCCKPSTSPEYTDSGQFDRNVARLKDELTISAGKILTKSFSPVALPECVEMDPERDPQDSELEFFLLCKQGDLYTFLMLYGPVILAYAAQRRASKVGIYWAY